MAKSVLNKINGSAKNSKKDLAFCLLLTIWPAIQFIVFYIIVNLNSILLPFSKTTISNGYHVSYSLDNFKVTWDFIVDLFDGTSNPQFFQMLGLSLFFWAVSVLIGTPLGLLFSYYIAKKNVGHGFFRIVLYLPSIISVFILSIMFRYFMDYPFATKVLGLNGIFDIYPTKSLSMPLRIMIIALFNIFLGFGTSVLMYSNSMSQISPEILESASLDGAVGFKEFIHIVFPSVWPTFSVFFVTSIAQIFTNQNNLYSLYGNQAITSLHNTSVGYYMFIKVAGSTTGSQMYNNISLLGILLSAFVIPVTFIVRKLMNKFGPSAE